MDTLHTGDLWWQEPELSGKDYENQPMLILISEVKNAMK